MTIQPNSGTETPAQMAAQAFAPSKQNQQTQPNLLSDSTASTDTFSSSSVGETESAGAGELDASSADQLTQALTKSMFDNSAQALTAQSGLNSQSALELIQ